MADLKQVIVMRTDLNMRKGKMIAQGAHASLAWLTNRLDYSQSPILDDEPTWDIAGCLSDIEKRWLDQSFTKICVQIGSEQELLDIVQAANEAAVECSLIQDSGRTEFGGVPTYTCCSLGPDNADLIDKITGHLKLL